MAIVKEKRYILAELGSNHNKWYNLELHDDGQVVSRWGRIGDSGQEKALGYGETLFESKAAEKEKKGYVQQRILPTNGTLINKSLHPTNLERVATTQIAANSPEAISLIKKLVKANVHQIVESTTLTYNSQTGLFSTPLGIVTQDALDEAREALTRIGDYVAHGAWQDYRFQHDANRFLTLVPQNIGRTRQSCRDLFPDLKTIRQKNDILDRLETSLKMAMTDASSPNEALKLFDAKIHLVESRSEFRRLRELYRSTLNRQHTAASLELKRVYSVEIASMKKAFEERSQTINNVMELWHGTNTGNILSILKDGFRVKPPSTATITGKMFGEGVYFAIQSSKSLNYAHGFWSGQRHQTCYMFLCDVAVGRYQVPSGATSKRPDKGYDSYWARPNQTAGIVNDELVVFNSSSICPKFLLEFRED